MNWREKLADWISGGALTFHRNGWERSIAIAQDRDREIAELKYDNERLLRCITAEEFAATYFQNTLRAIAAEEKPTSNATVKRMARMAREALK